MENRRILLMGLPNSGKTRLVVSQFDYMVKPVAFFSEMPETVIAKTAEYFGTSMEGIKIIMRTPTVEELKSMEDLEYKTVIIDHVLRIKRISSSTTRENLQEMLEISTIDWIIIAHLMKGTVSDMDIWSGRWTSGIVEACDITLGLYRHRDFQKAEILKDRYYDYVGHEAVYPDGKRRIIPTYSHLVNPETE